MATYNFKRGDTVPDWVLRAEDPALQKEATFGVDVSVTRNEDGVTVYTKELGEGDCGCRISEAGSRCQWFGAPTEWYLKPEE